VEQQPHDVVLIDVALPPGNGFTAAYNLIQLHAGCRIMMFAYERNDDAVIEAFARGATAFFYGNEPEEDIIYKTTEMLKSGYCITPDTVKAYREALHRIALRQNPLNPLTRREKVVLQYIIKGMHNPQIAALLYRSVKTIGNQRNSIMHKAGCHNIVELMAHVRKMGWL
jgi:two-component system response regulator NreC